MTAHGLHLTESGSGPAVLWLHGYTMDSTLWRPLWDLLPGLRHIGVDLPGHGLSGPCPPGLTLPGLADRLALVAQETGARRVVGLSFGSTSALQLAMQRPDLVRRLVVAAPTLAGTGNDPVAEQRYKQLMLLHRMTGPGEQLTDLWMASPPDIFRGTEAHPGVRAAIRRVVLRHRWAELADRSMDVLTAHRHGVDDLRSISASTLAVVGSEDMPAFTANAGVLRAALAECRVVTVSGAGHLPLLEVPGVVAGEIAAHLS